MFETYLWLFDIPPDYQHYHQPTKVYLTRHFIIKSVIVSTSARILSNNLRLGCYVPVRINIFLEHFATSVFMLLLLM